MAASASRFLDPATLAGLRDLSLVARAVVDGFYAGEHPSRRSGSGLEFSQYRSYQPGDDPRRVDWRLFSRTDRFFVRESEVEREVTLRLLLDASGSMAHRSDGLATFDYARFLVASLAFLADRQGDRIELLCLGGGGVGDVEAARGAAAGRRLPFLLHRLESTEAAGAWPRDATADRLAARRRDRQLLVLVSDLHEREREIVDLACGLRALGQETLVFHLQSRYEVEFPYRGDCLFTDLESGETVRGGAEAMRAGYLRLLGRRSLSIRQRLTAAGVSYEALRTDRPLDQALRGYLLRRRRLP